MLQGERHPQNHVPSALTGVEDARAIGKFTIFFFEFLFFTCPEVEHQKRVDRFRDFLSVSSHVLHRSSAHASRNSAQALDTRAVMRDGGRYKPVPVLACAHVEVNRSTPVPMVDSRDGHLENQSRPPPVGYNQIAPSTEHEQRQLTDLGIASRFSYLAYGRCLNEVARWSAHLHGGQRRQGHVFLNQHLTSCIKVRSDYHPGVCTWRVSAAAVL